MFSWLTERLGHFVDLQSKCLHRFAPLGQPAASMPSSKPSSQRNRVEIIRSITTPLGFYVLALLIVELTLAIVLSSGKLSEEHAWAGFELMVFTFAAVVFIVTLFAAVRPRNLLYGKEEHANPALAPSALKDQIEDLIAANVKAECLKTLRD